MARAMARSLKADVTVATDPRAAARRSDIVVTCTSAQEPLLAAGDVMAGTFVAGGGGRHPPDNHRNPRGGAVGCVVCVVSLRGAHLPASLTALSPRSLTTT